MLRYFFFIVRNCDFLNDVVFELSIYFQESFRLSYVVLFLVFDIIVGNGYNWYFFFFVEIKDC